MKHENNPSEINSGVMEWLAGRCDDDCAGHSAGLPYRTPSVGKRLSRLAGRWGRYADADRCGTTSDLTAISSMSSGLIESAKLGRQPIIRQAPEGDCHASKQDCPSDAEECLPW
jgi:hypothetical protein